MDGSGNASSATIQKYEDLDPEGQIMYGLLNRSQVTNNLFPKLQ